VRYKKTHGKLKGLPCAQKKRTAKNFLPCIFSLPCVPYQTHGKVSLYRAPDEKCTAKIFTHDKSEFFRSGH
jgi:hypothetical protein